MCLHERIEDTRQLMFRDAHAGVFDLDRDRIQFRDGSDFHRDSTSVGIFDRVLEQITNHFLHANRIASNGDLALREVPMQL